MDDALIPAAGTGPAGRTEPAAGPAGPTGPAGPRDDLGAADVAGSLIGELGYALALAVTAGADVAVFDQVVSIAMPSLPTLVTWLTVAGFTASSLTLAHFTGRLVRDRATTHATRGRRPLLLLVIPWGLLGLVAFLVRLIVAGSGAASATAVGGQSSSTTQLASAIMFLALYAASGAVAGFGEYLTRNPSRARYRVALRGHRRAARRLARSQPAYERAWSVLHVHTLGRQREEQNYQAAYSLRLAFADELKRHAAVLIAAHLQAPAATDGMTLPDRIPLPDPPGDRNGVTPRDDPADPA